MSVLAVFPEARGRQIGQRLLKTEEKSAKETAANEISLMVGSFNEGAHRLYEGMGYTVRAHRDFVSFEGSDRGGRWLLLTKALQADI